MKTTTIDCSHCGESFSKSTKEYRRRAKLGYVRFYCSVKCQSANRFNNRAPKIKETRKCLYCSNEFVAEFKRHKAGRKHCSISCASKNSLTPKRIEGSIRGGKNFNSSKNLNRPSETLKKREAWKYEKLKCFLNYIKVKYEFEMELGGYVFDLALTEAGKLVEFDGPDHIKNKQQVDRDKVKKIVANKAGFTITRIKVAPNTVIPPYAIDNILMEIL